MKLVMGPCVIESKEFLLDVAAQIHHLLDKHFVSSYRFDYYFKSSFDKANRTSITSFRGPGLEKGLEALEAVKAKYGFKILTDFHEPGQAAEVATVADVLQVPAFMCRQTDLLVAAVKTGKIVNIKKGQQMPASAMKHAANKCIEAGADSHNIWLTERGSFFGYGDLVVDMRNLIEMAQYGTVIFDATHSVQKPGGADGTTHGDRSLVLPLLRGAAAVGIDGAFLEVHPNPAQAKSDAGSQFPLQRIPEVLEILNRSYT